ncbi:MAG: cytochrome c3 family protein [Acidobacteriota bacterium]|nr:cytochrome c3 family protein [Acidobacteriota bacterium]
MTTRTTERRVALVLSLLLVGVVLSVTPSGAEEGDAQSCLECHEDMIAAKVVHDPAGEGSCDICHEGDAEEHDFTLPDPVGEACSMCHDIGGASGAVHGPVKAGQCTACHNPHASEQEKLLLAEGEALCWRCHGRTQKREGRQGVVENIRKVIAEAAVSHDALEMGCQECHPAHDSEEQGLFTMSFPAGPYARGFDGSYDLCMACHDESLIVDPQSLETGFRDGEKNLHTVHVVREKSRSCALCHSPHGGGDHLLRKDVRFGQWLLPIGYEPSETGGTCTTACHETRVYDRSVPPPVLDSGSNEQEKAR